MHVYKTLRRVAMALRAIELALIKSMNNVGEAAERVADTAIEHGHKALDKQEERAFYNLVKVKAEVVDSIEVALGDEEDAHLDYQDTIAVIKDHRRMLETEVL